jgi:hypothetical protein
MTDLYALQDWAADRMLAPPDYIIGPPENPYLRRWWVIPRNPFLNVYLHEILRSDDDRAGHDHPWVNETFVIQGSYEEVVYYRRSERIRLIRSEGERVRREAVDTHRLIIPEGGRAVTLFTTGPVIREWGFWCQHGWVPWQQFTDPAAPGQIGRGCGE